MPLTKEQLLIPRVKCAIRYPDIPFPVGAILEQDFEEPETYNYTDSNRRPWMIENPELYPETFIQLPWWSDRKPEDMEGLFIKSEQGYCYKINCHYITDNSKKDPEPYFYDDININGWYYFQLEPTIITEEEYTAYINQK